MSLNGKKISEFKLQAYQNEDFIEVTDKDLLGKWSVLFFYPADFTFVCPTELVDVAEKYEQFQIPISSTKLGMNLLTESARLNIR